MRKIAIFVEGLTEQLFVERLLEELAGRRNIRIDLQRRVKDTFSTVRMGNNGGAERYFALILDCANDERVKSEILDQRESLMRADYELIVGLRDLYPSSRTDFAKLRRMLAYGVPTNGIRIHLVLAVMEIEAWFIQEGEHYQKIGLGLTKDVVRARLGFDPDNDSAEMIDHPSEFLDQAYQIVGKRYQKTQKHIARTVNAIDYARMFMFVPQKCPALGKLIEPIEQFLT